MLAERKKVGLVLSGGGAKGAAHIGVLKVLEEAEIPIDYIAGTSIGSIVGGLYAIGYSASQLDSVVKAQNWSFLLSNEVPKGYGIFRGKDVDGRYVLSLPYNLKKKISLIPTGYINGQNIINFFSGLTIGYHELESFNKLPIPFACVAADLISKKEVVINKGSLPLAMRSSMSIPGVFLPVDMDSMLLIDGGVLNNFPVNVVKEMGADIIIGVDLSNHSTSRKQLDNINGVISSLVDINGSARYAENLKDVDLYLQPNLHGFQTMDFKPEAIDSIYVRGIDIAREHWDELMNLKRKIYDSADDLCEIPVVSKREYMIPTDTLSINDVIIKGVSPETSRFLRHQIRLNPNSVVPLARINEAVTTLKRMSFFSDITYHLSDQAPYDLTFYLTEKEPNHINIGVRFDSEIFAALLLNTTLYQHFFSGYKLSVTTRLSLCPQLSVNYHWRPNRFGLIGTSYSIGFEHFRLYEGKHKLDDVSYLWQNAEIKYAFDLKGWDIQGGVRWSFFGVEGGLFGLTFNPFVVKNKSYFNYFANVGINTLNNHYFPTKGIYININGQLITDNFASYEGEFPICAGAVSASLPINLSNKFCLIPTLNNRIVWGKSIPSVYQNYGGGSMNGRYLPQQISLPGMREVQHFDNVFFTANLAFRYNLLKRNYLFLTSSYVNSSTHIKTLPHGTKYWCAGAKYSYNSQIGPISGEVNYSNKNNRIGVYFNLGYNF